MATPVTTPKSKGSATKPATKNGLALVWLDDSVEQDPNVKAIFHSLYEHVFTFIDPGQCLELVESAEPDAACISALVSGKFGQMLAHDRLQPLEQIKDIYVYCFDIAKHNQWAQKCSKVRCVDSDFAKILKCMQHDVQKRTKQKPTTDQPQPEEEQQQPPPEVIIPQEPERFADDNNLYDHLALNILLQNPDDDDNGGADDFRNYCQTHQKTQDQNDGDDREDEGGFEPNLPLKDWYKPDLCFVNLNSTDFTQLWTLRWFVRLFHRQLHKEHERFIKDERNFQVFCSTYMNSDELDGMKHRIGQTIICNELLTTFANKRIALDSVKEKKGDKKKHKILFEINVDPNIPLTVPYTETQKDEVLFWFGSRYRLMKIEFFEQPDSYWLIGINLGRTLDAKPSIENLYQYYFKSLTELKNVHHALGRILMYKGLYYQAEKWLQTNNHYEDLALIAIRQNRGEQANQYLQHLPEDSDTANLLRAYVYLLSKDDNITKGRTLLLRINSEAEDKIVRARANIALGFINLALTQQIDDASLHFTLGNDVLKKLLPDIHPDIAKSFIGLGYTHFVRHDINEAEKHFQMAFQIQKQSLSYKHPDIAKTHSGLAHCFASQKQTVKQALKEFEVALNILIQTFPREYKNHPEIALTMIDIERLRKAKELRARATLLDYI